MCIFCFMEVLTPIHFLYCTYINLEHQGFKIGYNKIVDTISAMRQPAQYQMFPYTWVASYGLVGCFSMSSLISRY